MNTGMTDNSAKQLSVAGTIVSKNYFGFAKTLTDSFCASNPGHDFYILVVDAATDRQRFVHPGAKVIFLQDLGIHDWLHAAFRFDIMELNTNVKASFLQYLLAQGHPRAYYFDPDIHCYSSVAPLDAALGSANVLLTPHALSPLPDDDGRRPIDRDFTKCGVYNLGFIGVANSEEGRRFLRWWERRCLIQGFNEPSLGLFVDQHWIDLVPCYFSGVQVFRHAGCNVAYWNLHERVLLGTEQAPRVKALGAEFDLIFFHFSGIDPKAIDNVSKHQNRFALADRPDLRLVFPAYAQRLLNNGYESFKSERYAFATFRNGERICTALRRYFSELRDLREDADPFAVDSKVYSFARRNRLISKTDALSLSRVNSMTLDDQGDRRVKLLGAALRAALYVLGPSRYELFSKAIKNYGVLNNQAMPMFGTEASRSAQGDGQRGAARTA